MTAPTPLPRSSVITTGLGGGGRDDVVRKMMNHPSVGSGSHSQGSLTSAGARRGGGAMVDSYLSSFNNVSIATTATLEDYEDDDEVFQDNVVLPGSAPSYPFRPHAKKGPAPPVPPQPQPSAVSGSKPAHQKLSELPGLSIVTWEEFLESPSVLCGLFQVDRDDFIRYNAEQVNVFFHDSRMEQPTLGAPSGDGLSWTIFIDSYNHLRSVRTWLTQRVSIILLQLLKGTGKGRAACLVAINPLNQSVGAELGDSFSRAIDAFLHHRNFCIELNLNSCVQTWCRTVLKMPCRVRGGRLVVTNSEESVPCSRVTSLPFCVLCFPVWGCQKLSYRFKRRSQYEDCFLYFKAEDLALCTKSPKLMQYAEKNNNTNSNHVSGGRGEKGVGVTSEGKKKPWIKKNRKAVTIATQTLDTGDDLPSGHMDIEEVEDDVKEDEDSRGREQQQAREAGRTQHSMVSSTLTTSGTNTERLEPHVSNGYPSYRPAHSITARLRDTLQEHGGQPGHPLAGSKSNLLSVSTLSSSSCSTVLPTADRTTLSSTDPTPRDGAHVLPVGSIHHPGVEEEEGEEEDSLSLHTPLTPRTPRSGLVVGEDPRAVGLDPVSTLPSVGSDDEHGGGNYRLQPETPSPRPDTPFHKRLPPQARKLQRPKMVHDVIVDESEDQGSADPRPPEERVHRLKGSTDADLPPEPGNKQRKKRISKVLRDMTGRGGQHAEADGSSAGPPHLRGEEGGLCGRDNQAFVKDEPSEVSFRQVKNGEKVKYTPIKGLNEKSAGHKAFPYTSELMDFVGENSKNKSSYSPAHQASKNSEDKKLKKKKSAVQKKAEDMLFAPRFVLSEDQNNRNCLSDNDIADDDFGDMEPDSVMSDVEGVASPRLIPVKKTERTISVNSVYTPRSEADTEWEITDCELEEDPRRRNGPKILAGAKGAQQLRSTSAHRSRESSATNSADARRRGGIQNDSRRRYIALNSLRRKANQLARQAELRKQKRPDSSDSTRMELQEV